MFKEFLKSIGIVQYSLQRSSPISLKYGKTALKQFGPILANNVSIADFEEALNHREIEAY